MFSLDIIERGYENKNHGDLLKISTLLLLLTRCACDFSKRKREQCQGINWAQVQVEDHLTPSTCTMYQWPLMMVHLNNIIV